MKKLIVTILIALLLACALGGCTYSDDRAREMFLTSRGLIDEMPADVLMTVIYRQLDVSACEEDNYSKAKLTEAEAPAQAMVDCGNLRQVAFDDEALADATFTYSVAIGKKVVKAAIRMPSSDPKTAEYVTIIMTISKDKITVLEITQELCKTLPYKNILTGSKSEESTVTSQIYLKIEA